jgi:hypothetical protein
VAEAGVEGLIQQLLRRAGVRSVHVEDARGDRGVELGIAHCGEESEVQDGAHPAVLHQHVRGDQVAVDERVRSGPGQPAEGGDDGRHQVVDVGDLAPQEVGRRLEAAFDHRCQ